MKHPRKRDGEGCCEMNQSVKDILKRMKTGDYNCSQCGDMCDCPKTDKIIKRFAREIDAAHLSETRELVSENRELIGLANELAKSIEKLIECSGNCANCSVPICTTVYNRRLIAKARKFFAELTGGKNK